MKLLLAFLSLAGILSCQQMSNTAPEQGESIYYYPSSNVYFDADNKHYIVLDTNKGWLIKEELSPEQESNLGRKVLVANPALPVWKANGDHKMIYSASLYTTNEDYRQKFTEDSLNSLPKKTETLKTVSGDSTEAKKEKRGVGKFLDRLFGGKDKKKDKKQAEIKPEES